MPNLLLFVACLLIGLALRRLRDFPSNAHLVLNNLLLYVCLPAATLLHTSETQFDAQFLFPVLMPWLSFIGSFLFFRAINPYTKFDTATQTVLSLTAGIPSVSFVGFPIFEALFGKKGLEIGIVMSQSGSFLVCSTLGVMLASYYAAEKVSLKNICWSVLKFPTFLAFIFAIYINLSEYHFLPFFKDLLQKLSVPFSFLALISIGLQIDLQPTNWQIKALKWGFFYKLILIPSIIFVLYRFGFQQKGILFETAVLGAGIGPMNTIAIIASKYKLNPKLAAQMVGLGIPLSLLSVLLFYLLLYAV